MKQQFDHPARIGVVLPQALKTRLLRQAAKETTDRGTQVTPSQIVRWALEDYLDQWETATFEPDKARPSESGS